MARIRATEGGGEKEKTVRARHRRRREGGREGGQKKGERETYGDANLSGVATSEGGRFASLAQRRGVARDRALQREADGAVILNEKDGHVQVGLLDVPTPVGLIWWAPDCLRDDVAGGRGDIVEKPEREV
jgi:hypothetical protein